MKSGDEAIYLKETIDLWCVDNLTSRMENIRHPRVEGGLYPWGKAELTGKWVILHKDGETAWAIFFHKKEPSVAIPVSHGEILNSGAFSELIPSDILPKKL